MLVAGVDSSTQSTKVVLCDADDGTVVGRGSAPHPPGTEVDPAAWWDALGQAGAGLLDRAAAVGVAGQQHGMVVLDEAGKVIRPALLWNDLRSAGAAAELIGELGGRDGWAKTAGSVPTASFTVTKLRWLATAEPDAAARVRTVLLPHDWLTWRLAGAVPGAATTDRGDASGTGYFSPASGEWLPGHLSAALGHAAEVPRVAAPGEVVGEVAGAAGGAGGAAGGALLSAGTGDNMAAALGLGLAEGDVAISIGTSGTAFAVSTVAAADPSGAVAGFADATGRFLPLVCTINAGLVLSAVAGLLGVSLDELSVLALQAGPGSGGLTLLPYFDGERTPDRPDATGVLRGLTTGNATRPNLARATVEAVLASLAEAAALLAASGARPRRVLLIGGGARSGAVCRLAPGIFAAPVTVPEPEEYVALGAARQAAWALSGAAGPPDWPSRPATEYTGEPQPAVRQRHVALRDDTAGWPSR
ncbi:MAG TPA: xylulokinase [Streptosporangiaceae bacterium]|nr:xylulokinase [Streptosporangiaceae bacterium]